MQGSKFATLHAGWGERIDLIGNATACVWVRCSWGKVTYIDKLVYLPAGAVAIYVSPLGVIFE